MFSARISDLFKGWNVAPRLVGVARGVVEVAVLAGLTYLGTQLGNIAGGVPSLDSPERVGMFMAAGGFVIRWLEAEADQLIDPQQNRLAEMRAARTAMGADTSTSTENSGP